MNKKILLLHGWGGSDFPHWQSWVAGEIAKDYGEVCFLKFSDFDAPKLSLWKQELQKKLQSFQPDIVVCHSLANTLWFHLCNSTTMKTIEYLYLVAPPSLTCKVPELQEFFPILAPSNLYAKNSLLVGSSDNPYMHTNELESLASRLNINVKLLKNAGHINAQSGYGEWPWILKELQAKSKT